MAMTTCRECGKSIAVEAPTCVNCGVPNPGEGHAERSAAKAAEERKAGRGCLLLVLSVGLLIGLLAWIFGGEGNGNSSAAYTACKRAAIAQLTNPATADFKISAITVSKVAAGYRVTGPLKAKTGFGVEQDLRFDCTATTDGTVVSIQVR